LVVAEAELLLVPVITLVLVVILPLMEQPQLEGQHIFGTTVHKADQDTEVTTVLVTQVQEHLDKEIMVDLVGIRRLEALL